MIEKDISKKESATKMLSFEKGVYKKIFLTGLALLFAMFLFSNIKIVGDVVLLILGILRPFIIGGVIAFIIKIPLNYFENKFFDKVKNEKFKKHKRTISILVSYIVILLIFSLISGVIFPQLVKSFKGLEDSMPSFVQNVIDKSREVPLLNRYSDTLQKEYDNLSWNRIFNEVKTFLSNENTSSVLGSAINAASSIVGGLVTFALAFISSIYILSDKERLGYQATRLSYGLFSEKTSKRLLHVAHILHDNFYGFIKGQLTVSFLIGVATGVLSFVIRIPNAATLGVIVGVTDLVPIIGPFIGGAMGFILTVIDDPTKAIIFVILIVILQQVESNIVYPKVVGDNVGLPSLWTLVAITLGGSLFGVVGMWIFIPLASTIYMLLSEYTKYKVDKKGIRLRMKKI